MGSHVLRQQEEDEAHAVDEQADVLEQVREGHGPQVRAHEGGLVLRPAEARREVENGGSHDEHGVADDDGDETEGGDGHQHASVNGKKRGYVGSLRMERIRQMTVLMIREMV